MKTIQIEVRHAGGSYPVLVGSGLTRGLTRLLRAHDVAAPSCIVTVSPVWRRHGARLAGLGAASRPALIPDGERAKTLATVARLYDACAAAGLDRQSTLLAFGGGVTGDVAGFAAATYLRGLPIIQVPTTLLAQVDSAIGGKVGVNLRTGKNLVGAFHAPALVVCDIDVLKTLPMREFTAGMYEVVKYGVIASRRLFDRVESRLEDLLAQRPGVLAEVVADCCRIKARVVGLDEREAGLRRTLNFGHTVGHALETLTRYRRFRHGEAVAHGMRAAAHLSMGRGVLRPGDAERISTLVGRVGRLPPTTGLRVADALEVIGRDKKSVGGRLHFVLAAGIGRTTIASDLTRRELTDALRAIGLR